MRVAGYLERDRFPGVTVLERAEAELPLARVCAERVGSLDLLEPPGLARLYAEPSSWEGAGVWNAYAPLRYRAARGRVRSLPAGLLRYASLSELIEFLLERLLPLDGEPLAQAVRNARETPSSARAVLEEFVLCGGDPDPRPWRRRRRHAARGAPDRPLPLASCGELTEALHPHLTSGRRKLLFPASYGYRRGPVVVRDHLQRVSGAQVPRSSYLVWAQEGDAWSDAPCPLLACDGQQVRWLRGPGDLPPAARQGFDGDGRMYRSADFDVLPLVHLRARCLVPVPPRAALSAALGQAERLGSPHRLLERPAYVLDSREPLLLRGDEPIVDAPEAAAFVLARTTRAIFVPDDRPQTALPLERLPARGGFLVLADVGTPL